MLILEPCCKITQFAKLKASLRRTGLESFTHYGDVTFPDWFSQLLLDAKGADAFFRFKSLDVFTLNFILNRMRDHAFIPGKELTMLNRVFIHAHTIPDPLPQRAEILMEEGRLKIQKTRKVAKVEAITLTPPTDILTDGHPQFRYKLEGFFFAEEANEPRRVTIKALR